MVCMGGVYAGDLDFPVQVMSLGSTVVNSENGENLTLQSNYEGAYLI